MKAPAYSLTSLFIATSVMAASGLQAVPETLSIQTGESGTSTLLLSDPVVASSVPLTINGLPKGVSATFTPASATSDKKLARLTLASTKDVAPGSYALLIEGKDLTQKPLKLEIVRQVSFVHPGVLLNSAQLENIAKNVNSGLSPWKEAFAALQKSSLAAIDYQPTPLKAVNADNSADSNAILNDANAAYSQALLWVITKDARYAQNAIRIMNAWASTFSAGFSGANDMNLASWTGDVWPRAAEIIRYTYLNDKGAAQWAGADIARFKDMLAKQYAPLIVKGRPFGFYGGNLNASSAAAAINIGVFNDDSSLFLRGLTLWRSTLPAYIYLVQDGPQPFPPLNWSDTQSTQANISKLWYNQPTLVNGLSQETCRDLGHVAWGLGAGGSGQWRRNGLSATYRPGLRIDVGHP